MKTIHPEHLAETPLEKMRARGESIILMQNGTTKRLKVNDPRSRRDGPHIKTGGRKIYVRLLLPPEETSRGLPIEWEEVPDAES